MLSRSVAVLRRNRDFRLLTLATLISLIGDWFSFVAVASLAIEVTGHEGSAAFTYAAGVLPVFFAAPVAGWAADRFDRKRILVISDVLRVPCALALCLANAEGSLALALACVALLGVGESFFEPAASAATPNLVEPEDLAAAQALMGFLWGSMLLVGAGLGGLVTAHFGRTTAFVIDAATFAVSAVILALVRRPTQQASAEERARAARDGDGGSLWGYLRATPLVGKLVLAKVGVGCANGIVGLLPSYALRRFRTTDAGSGFLFAARGTGALLGPLLARGLVGDAPRLRTALLICGGASITYAASYALLPVAPSLLVAGLLVVCAHVGGGTQWMLSSYALQTQTPDHLRGRVMSLDYALATLAIGGSAVAAGLLANTIGADATTWGMCGLSAVYGTVWLLWTRPHWR